MMRRYFGLLLLCGFASLAVAGCGESPPGQLLEQTQVDATLQRSDLPEHVQAALRKLEAAKASTTNSWRGVFEINDETVFCVFKDGWRPASDHLLRQFEHPYETASGVKTYQLISDVEVCSSQTNAIFFAAISEPQAFQSEGGPFEYQLWLAAWQDAGMEGNAIFAATIARDEPREDAVGILDTVGSSAPDASDLAMRMSQSLGADGTDMITSFARQVRAERESQ